QEIAPEGWEHSPLAAVFHPSAEQVYEERLRFHRNLAALRRKDAPPPPRPEPTREDVARDYRPAPVEAAREIPELGGQRLWDIFSDNHEVVGPDGRLLDLGSFRASRRLPGGPAQPADRGGAVRLSELLPWDDLAGSAGGPRARLPDDFPPSARPRVRLGL